MPVQSYNAEQGPKSYDHESFHDQYHEKSKVEKDAHILLDVLPRWI